MFLLGFQEILAINTMLRTHVAKEGRSQKRIPLSILELRLLLMAWEASEKNIFKGQS